MKKELTINISDETYQGLINLVGEQNASRFIESVLRPYILPAEENRTFKILSPRLADQSQAELLELKFIDN